MQQDQAGFGQRDRTAVSLQQCRAQAPFELADRPGQRRLGHTQTLRRPAEMQLFGDGNEVPQFSGLHAQHGTRPARRGDTLTVSLVTQPVLDVVPARHARSKHD